jgi:response regulator of citrate/malate metabolism
MAKKNDPAYVTDLGQRLMAAKAECKRLQAEWDALFSGGAGKDGQLTLPGRITMAVQITQFLDNSGGTPFTSDQVSTALGLKRQSAATTLSKLVKRGTINKFGNDQYTSKLPATATVTADAKKDDLW